MLARFSVAYERFCRLLLTIFVVNIAMLVHTLLGAVVLGFFPSCAAAQTTFRTWLRAEDRSMRAKEVWGIFHGAWKNELKQANLFGWPLAVCWVVLAIDYYMMNWHARGTFDVAVSGILFVLALVLLAFTMLVWVVRANYDDRPHNADHDRGPSAVHPAADRTRTAGDPCLGAMAGSAHGVRHVAADVLHCVDRVLVRPDSGNGHP